MLAEHVNFWCSRCVLLSRLWGLHSRPQHTGCPLISVHGFDPTLATHQPPRPQHATTQQVPGTLPRVLQPALQARLVNFCLDTSWQHLLGLAAPSTVASHLPLLNVEAQSAFALCCDAALSTSMPWALLFFLSYVSSIRTILCSHCKQQSA